jgi:hypothetical protein
MLDLGCPLLLLATPQIVLVRTLALTLSNDALLTIEKQMRKTSVCGYESGRRRS